MRRFAFFYSPEGETPIGGGPAPTPAPAVTPRETARGVTCEFCECRLDSAGAVLIRGAEAKRFMDLELAHAAAVKELDAARVTITQLTPPAVPKRTGLFSGDL